MLMPLFFVPFDGYLILAAAAGVWIVRHNWRNATVRRLQRIVARDRRWLVLAVVCVASVSLLAQGPLPPPPSRTAIRAIHIEGYQRLVGSERKVASCLMEKLGAQAPFTFPDSDTGADAILSLQSHVPSGGSRVMWGSAPTVIATLRTPDGATIWHGENKYKKGTTLWGTGKDMECGLANGLANKLVQGLTKAGRFQ